MKSPHISAHNFVLVWYWARRAQREGATSETVPFCYLLPLYERLHLTGRPCSPSMAAKGSREVSMKRKMMYVCDRKKCPVCPTACKHTMDITHAKYDEHFQFEVGPDGTLWEVVRK